jgi:hypothetical protein
MLKMSQNISGRYKEIPSNTAKKETNQTEAELRIDVDGNRPLNVISGDIYSNSGDTRNYLCSFIFQHAKKIETPTKGILLTAEKGKFSQNPELSADIQVEIPHKPHSPAAVFQFRNSQGYQSKHLCRYESKYFRTIRLKHDYEVGVKPLEPYEAIDLDSTFPHRTRPISIVDAFAEAGIEILVVKEKENSVITPERIRGFESVWTDDKLQKTMLAHFKSFSEEPDWSVWLFSASEYVMSNFNGITISTKDNKRRGCAVFQTTTGWRSTEEKRLRLFIYVHEIGHCFNLHHPWVIAPTNGAEVGGYATLSWMNLPWRYYKSPDSYGEKAFWKAFDFQFSDSELVHLRHGFRNDVIFGGNAFGDKKSKSQN